MSLLKQERRADQCAEHHHSHHILSQVGTPLNLCYMVNTSILLLVSILGLAIFLFR